MIVVPFCRHLALNHMTIAPFYQTNMREAAS